MGTWRAGRGCCHTREVQTHTELSLSRLWVVGHQPQRHGIEQGPWWGPFGPFHGEGHHGAAACQERRSKLLPRRSVVYHHHPISHYLQHLWKLAAKAAHLSVADIGMISISNMQFHKITLKPMHIRKKIESYVHSIISVDLHSNYKLIRQQHLLNEENKLT